MKRKLPELPAEAENAAVKAKGNMSKNCTQTAEKSKNCVFLSHSYVQLYQNFKQKISNMKW